MRHVLGAFGRYSVKVAMVAAAMIASTAGVSTGADLPPCGVGRIVNYDTLSLSDCTISDNVTQDPGGGVENYGTMDLTNVVISGNRGASGGGIYNGGGMLTLTNVIISGNVADGIGGGIFNDGGAVFMSNVTIAGNRSGAGGGGLANLSGASTIGANVALIENETMAGDGGGILNDSSVCLSAGDDFDACFHSPAGGNSLVRDNHAAGNGGGIANLGSIVLSDSTVDRNRAEGGNGGGVWNEEGLTQLANVTISHNTTTGDGGGLFSGGFGAVCCTTLENDYAINLTIAGNHADGNGGGVSSNGGAYTALASATIAGNTTGGSGGGVHNDDASYAFTELKDTLLAWNGPNCAGTIFSAGHNLDTGLTCGLSQPDDKTDVQDEQVGLNSLAANGGPAQGSSVVFDQLMTSALNRASPAVDAGSDGCPATDERGVPRPQGAACDIGAFELEPAVPTTVTATITAANKTYDATTEAAITTCTLSGVLPPHDVSCVASDGAFDTANVGTGKQVTATVALTGAAAGDYRLSSSSAMATADITPAPAFVTPDSAGKTYGTADPALTGTVSGFYGIDNNVAATYYRTPGENVAGSPYTISATLSPAAALENYTVTYNTASFTIDKVNASVTPNAASKTYGTADPALTGTLSGFLAADGVTATYSRSAGETVAGSPYAISATLSPTGALTNYNVTDNTASFTIDKANASVTPNASSKTYGAADPALSGTLSGFLAADGVTATYSRSAGETVAGSPYAISATLSPTGALANYNVIDNTAAFTITKANASVTPNANTKVYGAADPALTGTLSGFLAADGVTATYSRTAGETVAGSPYAISATLSPTGALANYNVTDNPAAFTITKANASVTPNANTKVYGTADPALAGTLSGFLAADDVTATYSRTAGETVAGSPYAISATLSSTGVLANYNVTDNTAAFTITKANASVTPDANTKVYGTADPALAGTLSGFLAADDVTATYSRTVGETVAGSPSAISAALSPTGALANYKVTNNTAAFSRMSGESVTDSPYTISATLSPASVLDNYSVTYDTASFTIDKANASVTPNANTKVYGAADPALTGTLSGFLAADDVTATYSRTAGESVGGSPYAISATLSPMGVLANYNVTDNTAAFTITRANASVTPNANTKVYGAADPALTGTLSGFLAADDVTATYSRSAGETVAGGPYVISPILSPTGALANYNVAYNTAAFTITKANASVTPNANTKVYGAADPALTGTLSGFLAADDVTATYSRSAGETVAGGPYVISPILSPTGALANYNVAYNTAAFTITRVNASVTPNANTKVYGTADPALTGTISGFLAADGVTATYSRAAGETVAGGPYAISATLSPTGALANYNVTENTAAFTITRVNASVTPIANTKVYGTADPALTGTISGFLAADGVTATYSRAAGETVAGGPYAISATLSPTGALANYNITDNTASFTITKANASVTPNAATKVYGNADPVLSGALSGFRAVDGITASYSRTAGETVAGSSYLITATLSPAGVVGNYTITYNTAGFTITKAPASVSPAAAAKVYGSADPTLSGSLSGFRAVDGVTASYSRTAGESIGGSPYAISATLSPAGVLVNYTITYNTAGFTITKANASMTPNAANKMYGTPDPTLTGTLAGFRATDGVTASYSRTPGETVAGSPYLISATLSPAGVLANYNVTYNTANFTITPPCVPLTFNFANGTSAVTGTAGNIRTFAAGGVSVKVSAFSETKPGAVFNTAYLGHYSAGLGVTDGSENGTNSTHVTDNYGRNNYILFEFSQSVTIDKSYLEYIVGDSDMSVWIGTIPNAYTGHQTLSAALLSGLAFNETSLGGSASRTAELNAGSVSGNILVIATKKDETNDAFKVKNVTTLCPQTVCTSAGEFAFSGSTATSGTAGNIRTFAASGVNVKASAFSRTDSTGAWLTAFLGAYSGGLGVTDTSEGTGANETHKVDNVGGRNNYVLFEFDKTVVINKAFLDVVGADSDISIWIGTKTNPYTTHLTLSDALLASLAKEDNATANVTSGSRSAEFNPDKLSGNVLVISSLVGDQTPEDAFKIAKLALACQ